MIFVSALSVVLQFIAAYLSIRLIRITGRRRAWILIAAAITIAAIRRSYDLYRFIFASAGNLPNTTGELFSLLISICIVIGVAYIAPLFQSIKRSEESLRSMVKHIKDLYNNAPCGYHSLDGDGVFVHVNDTELKWLGYSRDEFLNKKHFFDLMTPESAEVFNKIFPVLKERGYIKDVEYDLLRKDGTFFHVLLNATTVRDENGNFVMSRCTMHDITRLKEAEKIMKQLSTAVEQTSDWILITDKLGRIEYANKAVEQMTGYKKEEIIGKTPRIFKSGRYDKEFYKNMWDSILSGKTFRDIMTNRRKDGGLFEVYHTITPIKDSNGQITHFVASSKDITAVLRLEEQINFLATHDDLTGLPNRSLFVDRLRQDIARSEHDRRYTGILFIDVDRLLLINDAFGSQAGDSFLAEIGRRLQTAVRDGDTVARFGSDEFAVSLADVTKSDDIILILEDIRKVLAAPYSTDGKEAMITFSMGVSIHPTDSKAIDALIENAVIACQKAKGLGGNGYQFFTPDMNSKALEFVSMERNMFNAIRNGEFILHYQPYYDMASRELVGMEALLRWRRGDGGLVPPGQFIPVLEETCMIVEVGEWVLRATARQMKEWQDKGYPVVPVSVNLSSVQFRQRDLLEVIKRIVQEYGVPPSLLVLEITESAFMENPEFTKETLENLRSLGVSISIDDFGTGYSSLSYLKRFPIDNLKIDGSFIRDLGRHQDAESIVKAIITMGHALNLKTIAEGIESEEQWSILRSMECMIAQGFHCSKPLAGPEFEKLFLENALAGN